MAIENDFLPFAVGSGANVLSQSAYAALTAIIQNGYQSGIANSSQMNKTWRQSSIMASVLAQFIVDRTGQTAIDDGTTATLLANLKAAAAALNGDSTQTFSVAPATQSNQAVNLGQFASSFGTNSFQKLAGGLIIQGGLSTTITAGTLLTINYPLAFPNGVFSIVGSISSNATTAAAFVTTKSITNSQFGLALNSGTGSAYWIALGF